MSDPENTIVPAPELDGCRALTETLMRVGDKWTILVIADLAEQEPRRYNALKRAVSGISQRMLTLTLRGLEKDGLIERTVFPTTPPRVEYRLTTLGHTLVPLLQGLYAWSLAHRPDILAARERFRERD